MKKTPNINFIFYIYYALTFGVALVDFFLLHKVSSTIYFGLVSALIGLIVQLFYNDYKKQKKELSSTVEKLPKIELLHEEEFYARFPYHIHTATRNVDLAHLALESPLQDIKPEQSDYYKSLKKSVKSNSRVTFRRVERVSKDKAEWLQQLVTGFTGQTNFSLYCLVDDESTRNNEMSDLLSVQLIDDKHLFIVALLEHTSTKGHRDIYIRDEGVTGFFREYYKGRLVDKSVPIIVNGQLKNDKWEQIKATLK